jgi:hypothetical protein
VHAFEAQYEIGAKDVGRGLKAGADSVMALFATDVEINQPANPKPLESAANSEP